MSKQTQTRQSRRFQITKAESGHMGVTMLAKPKPATPRTTRTLKCGIMDFEILVSEGQLINERKMCKKLIAQTRKKHE